MRRDSLLLLTLGLFAVALPGCGGEKAKGTSASGTPASEAAGTLTDSDREAIRAGVAKFDQDVVASNWEGATAMYTDDAVLMPPNTSEVKGRDAIKKFLGGFPKISQFKQTVQEIQGGEGYAYPSGTYEMTFTPPGSRMQVNDKGKVLAVWRKQSDGSWKVTRVIWNSDAPPRMMR
jgi:uncharacterized protein (TIGR02246 family)